MENFSRTSCFFCTRTFKKIVSLSSVGSQRNSVELLGVSSSSRSILFPFSSGKDGIVTKISSVRLSKLPNDLDFVSKIRSEDFRNLLKATVTLRLITGIDVEVDLYLPKSKINPGIDFDRLESESIKLAKERGIYKGRLFNVLQKTEVAGLVAIAYPGFSENLAYSAIVHIANLFGIDDYVDDPSNPINHLAVKKSTKRKMEIIEDIIKYRKDFLLDFSSESGELPGVQAGEVAKYLVGLKEKNLFSRNNSDASDDQKISNLEYAFAEEFVKQLEFFEKGHSGDVLEIYGREHIVDQFIHSLESYFNSVVQEKRVEENKQAPNFRVNQEVRADASGAVHALHYGASSIGILLTELERYCYGVDNLIKYVARCVEYSNDIYSLYKEHSGLAGTQTANGVSLETDSLDLVAIRRGVLFNIVQILWQSDSSSNLSQSLVEAVGKAAREHNSQLEAYYESKSSILAILEQEILDLGNRISPSSISNKTLTSKAILEQQLEKLNKLFDVLEGWLAHGWWAMCVPRYNVGAKPSGIAQLLDLQDKQGQVLAD